MNFHRDVVVTYGEIIDIMAEIPRRMDIVL